MHSKPKVFFALSILLGGCAELPVALHSPASPPATAPVTGDIRLSDAQPMDDLLEAEDMQVSLTDKLDPPDAAQTVYFGEADEFDSDDTTTPVGALPLIAVHAGNWRAIPLVGPALEDAGWKYVGAGPARNEIWGVLDTSAGDSQPQFVIAHSTNGATTFTLKVMDKPTRLATVADFAMSRNGHGRVTLSLDTDCGKFKAGLYHYDTTDDGKTWSTNPRYEPDAMIQADTVPEDEQPTQDSGPSRAMFNARLRNRLKPGIIKSSQIPKQSISR
jgi:hypothetical protein